MNNFQNNLPIKNTDLKSSPPEKPINTLCKKTLFNQEPAPAIVSLNQGITFKPRKKE